MDYPRKYDNGTMRDMTAEEKAQYDIDSVAVTIKARPSIEEMAVTVNDMMVAIMMLSIE
jgi:hypothetical protein